MRNKIVGYVCNCGYHGTKKQKMTREDKQPYLSKASCRDPLLQNSSTIHVSETLRSAV